MSTMRVFLTTILVASQVLASSFSENDAIEGTSFEEFHSGQRLTMQTDLELLFPESHRFLVTGPMEVRIDTAENIESLFGSLRIITNSLDDIDSAVSRLTALQDGRVKEKARYLDRSRTNDPAGFRGVLLEITLHNEQSLLLVQTIQQTRWMIWYQRQLLYVRGDADRRDLARYQTAVSDYLHALDMGSPVEPPVAIDFKLPERIDLFAPPPDYVIPGYENYISYLMTYQAIQTDFASGLLGFIPSDSLAEKLVDSAPAAAFPNKEVPMLQSEFHKFFERGGSLAVINQLTADGFDTLTAGEYFFAVGLDGSVRFGRELLRADVERIEQETGRKLPRANHAFLFPGEPLLSAGAFFVEMDSNGKPRLSEVNAQSGHYFYSNVSPSIRTDISDRSDYYLLTLGHFFRALEDLGVPHDDVVWRKF